MEMKPGTLYNLQALRGIAVLLVLWRHSFVIGERNNRSGIEIPEIWKIGEGGVDLFFVISGFVMVLITPGRFGCPREIGPFLYQRFTRIYPLYWIYSLMILAIYFINPRMVNSSQGGQVDIFASFLLLPQDIMPLLGQGWTLEFEVYFYLVFALLLLAPERLLPALLLLWGAIVAAGWNLGLADDSTPLLHLVCNPLTVEFILGAFLALALRRHWRRGALLSLCGGFALLLAGSLWVDLHQFAGLRLFYYGLPAVMIVYGAVALEKESGRRFPRWIEAVGDASYSIYLSHILVVSTVGRVWKTLPIPLNGVWNLAGVIICMAVAAVAFGLASHRYLEKPLLRAFRERRLPRFSLPFIGGQKSQEL